MMDFNIDYSSPLIIGTILIGIFGFFSKRVWNEWNISFSGKRVKRNNSICQSKLPPPKTTGFSLQKKDILEKAERHPETFQSCEMIDLVEKKERNRGREHKRKLERQHSKRVSFSGGADNSTDIASKLNMDHIHLDFLDFLWGSLFVGPMALLLWKMGTLWLSLRTLMAKWGIITVQKCDVEAMVATLCLEQSQVIHYFTRSKPGSKDGNIAGFFFNSFPYVDNDCNFKVADLFVVRINLNTKRFVSATMDKEEITASEALILLWFNTIAAQHVKLHAMANWGVNNCSDMKEKNPFFYQNSVVTILYNYFGYTCFSSFMETWEKQGLLSEGWVSKQPLIQSFNHGIASGVVQHPNITELIPYSRFVEFIVTVRSVFLKEFADHKHLFPGVDGEAFFVGTVMHSLDHTLMEWNMVDPLWLDVDDPKFGKMAEIGRIVRAGFVEDVPFLYFQKRFKGSKHPFYKAVYEKAARVDLELADNMDTCIIK